MTRGHAQWWKRAAQSLSRAGLLWLALTAVALGSLVGSGPGFAPVARLVAASSVGTGKLKANGPEAPAIARGAIAHRALGPDANAKRIHSGGTPLGLVIADLAFVGALSAHPAVETDADRPAFTQSAFSARAPPA